MNVEEYLQRLRKRVGEAEYERHMELVRLLARNLALEDVLWEEILVSIRDVNARTEFRALNIEIPTVVERNTESFMGFLGDLDDDTSEERGEDSEDSVDGSSSSRQPEA